MTTMSRTPTMTVLVLLGSAGLALAQGGGGAGGAAGTGAAGAASGGAGPGAAGAATRSSTANPSAPGNFGGTGNPSTMNLPPPPGTNSAGTAQSSGVTIGSARTAPDGARVPGPDTSDNAVIEEESKAVDKKVKSICRGC
jgi:hypothetical protein